MQYVQTGVANKEDKLVSLIEKEVSQANSDPEWVGKMESSLSWAEDLLIGKEEAIEEARAEGEARGLAEGENRFAMLIASLLSAGRTDDVQAAATDPVRRAALMNEMGIL